MVRTSDARKDDDVAARPAWSHPDFAHAPAACHTRAAAVPARSPRQRPAEPERKKGTPNQAKSREPRQSPADLLPQLDHALPELYRAHLAFGQRSPTAPMLDTPLAHHALAESPAHQQILAAELICRVHLLQLAVDAVQSFPPWMHARLIQGPRQQVVLLHTRVADPSPAGNRAARFYGQTSVT